MGEQFDILLAREIAKYKQHNIYRTIEQLEDEVIADFAGSLAFETDVLDTFIAAHADKKTMWQAILDVLRAIREWILKDTAYETAEARALQNAIGKLEALFQSASEKVAEGVTAQNTETRNSGKEKLGVPFKETDNQGKEVKKTTLGERSDADSHNSSSEGLPLSRSERLSGNTLAPLKDNAKIEKDSQIIQRNIKKILNKGGFEEDIKTESQAVRVLGKAFKMQKSDGSQSYYGDYYEGDYLVDDKVVHLRISTHPATGDRMGNANADHKVSIVIRKDGEHYSRGEHNGYEEIIYEPIEVSPLDAANAVVNGVKALIETGVYIDITGKAKRITYPTTTAEGKVLYSLKTPTNEKVTFDNFFERTSAIFHFDGNTPTSKPNFVSPSSSRYWYGEDDKGKYVIRQSDHWSTEVRNNNDAESFTAKPDNYNNIASCYWAIDVQGYDAKYEPINITDVKYIDYNAGNHKLRITLNSGQSATRVVHPRDMRQYYAALKTEGVQVANEYVVDLVNDKYNGKPLPNMLTAKAYLDDFTKWEVEPRNSLKEMDNLYLDAVARGDMAMAQRMVQEAAEHAGYLPDTSYQGSLAFNGAAPTSNVYFETKEERKQAWDNDEFDDTMSLGDYADNGIDTNDLEWRLTNAGNYRRATQYEKESIDNINKALKNPEHKITIYRAVPNSVVEGSVRNGDWVTPSRSYAEYHIGLQDWEGGRVIEQEVSIDDIWWGGDDINEWGYDDGSNYGYRNTENNRKLLDTVVYDDAGNVIPLSERFNPEKADVRYNLKDTPSLVGVHNLSLDKLRKVIKMGGLANPSVAVIDADKQTHEDYGEYSLILPKNMVDARQGKNAGTWAGDAWTPTYPQITKRMSKDKDISRFYKDIDALPEAIRGRVRLDFNSFMDGRSANALAYWYLFDKGVAPALVDVPARYPVEIVDAINEATNGSFSMFRLSAEERAKCVDAFVAYKYNGDRAAYDADMAARKERLEIFAKNHDKAIVRRKAQEDLDAINEYGFDYDEISRFIHDVEWDVRHKGEIDVDATIKASMDYIAENNLGAEYDAWRNNLDERYGIEEYIFDGFTNSGTRRYLPHTVENASKWMKKQGRQGAVATFPSFGTFVAVSIPKMTTLESIRKRKNLLGKSKEEYNAFREKWENVYFELGKKLQPDAKGFDDYGYWRLIEAVGQKNPKEYIKKQYNIELSAEDVNTLNEMLNAIRTEYPARYFETKFERPLQLNDFVAAVVPDDVPMDVWGRLNDANVKIFEYEKGNSDSRAEAMQKATATEGVRFSLKLSKQEYAVLASEISNRQFIQKKPSFDYAYTYDNFYIYNYLGDGVFRINFAMPIVGDEDLIDIIYKAIDNGTINSTRSLDTLLEEIQFGKGGYNVNIVNALKKRRWDTNFYISGSSRQGRNTRRVSYVSKSNSGFSSTRRTSRNANELGDEVVKYSLKDTFYSNAENAVRLIKQTDNQGKEVKKTIPSERSDADSHNSSSEGLLSEGSERLSVNPLTPTKDVANIVFPNDSGVFEVVTSV